MAYIKMFVLLLLLVGSSFALATHCIEVKLIGLLDCSGLALSSLPRTDHHRPTTWVRSLDLERNNFVNINFSSVLANFPNVALVNLRHNPFNCVKVNTKLVRVLSDCIYNYTTETPNATTATVKSTTSAGYGPTYVISTTPQSYISTTYPIKNGQTGTLLVSFLLRVGVLTPRQREFEQFSMKRFFKRQKHLLVLRLLRAK